MNNFLTNCNYKHTAQDCCNTMKNRRRINNFLLDETKREDFI